MQATKLDGESQGKRPGTERQVKTQGNTQANKAEPTVDGVDEYAREALTLSLYYEEFHDAVREGDDLF